MVGRTGGLSQAERQPEMENKQSPEGRGEPLISLRLTHTCPCRRSVPSPFGQGTFTGIYTRWAQCLESLFPGSPVISAMYFHSLLHTLASVPGMSFPRVSGHQSPTHPLGSHLSIPSSGRPSHHMFVHLCH